MLVPNINRQGRERDLVAKVAEKYKAPHLLDKLKRAPPQAVPPSPALSVPSIPSSTKSTSIFGSTSGVEATPTKSTQTKPPKPPSPFGASSELSTAPSPFGASSSALTGQTTQTREPFGSPQPTSPSPFNTNATSSPFAKQSPGPLSSAQSMVANSEKKFNGKSARDMLTAFYTEKNPSKLSSIDDVLKKYQVRYDD